MRHEAPDTFMIYIRQRLDYGSYVHEMGGIVFSLFVYSTTNIVVYRVVDNKSR